MHSCGGEIRRSIHSLIPKPLIILCKLLTQGMQSRLGIVSGSFRTHIMIDHNLHEAFIHYNTGPE